MALLARVGQCARSRLARVLLAAVCLGAGPLAAAPPSAEYQLKAIFLFNFAQFVDWPAQALRTPPAPFVIGILGEDPFGDYLDETVRGEKIGGHPMVVQRYRTPEEATGCQVLFISRSESGRLYQIVAALKGRSILTVGDVDDFNVLGGIVRFVTEQGKIRLRIDVEAARAAGLTISSKLLRSATIVTGDRG